LLQRGLSGSFPAFDQESLLIEQFVERRQMDEEMVEKNVVIRRFGRPYAVDMFFQRVMDLLVVGHTCGLLLFRRKEYQKFGPNPKVNSFFGKFYPVVGWRGQKAKWPFCEPFCLQTVFGRNWRRLR
jgi:hypothetical protein